MKSGQLREYNCWEIIHKYAGETVPGQSWVYLDQLSKVLYIFYIAC